MVSRHDHDPGSDPDLCLRSTEGALRPLPIFVRRVLPVQAPPLNPEPRERARIGRLPTGCLDPGAARQPHRSRVRVLRGAAEFVLLLEQFELVPILVSQSRVDAGWRGQ